MADKIGVKGELFLFALYRGNDDTNSLQWLEHSVPFYQEMECPGCAADMIPNVEITMPQSDLKVKQDDDGEERILGVDAVLELEMKLYEEEELSLLTDVYTPARDCRAIRENYKLESLLVKNFSKYKVNDRVKVENSQGKILQICHSDGTVKVDSTQIVDNGILVEGIVQVRILYIIGDDEMPFYSMETMIPFSHVIEAEHITENCVYHLRVEGIVQVRILYIIGDDEMPFYSMETMIPFSHVIEAEHITENCVYHLRTDLEQLSTTMIDSDEIEVKIVMNLNAVVFRQTDLEQLSTTMIDSDEIEVKIVMNLNAVVFRQTDTGIIQRIEEHELDREKLRSMPGIVGYQVQPEDSLWDIAKKFYTTIDTIVQLNGLENERVKPYDTLILMKKVER